MKNNLRIITFFLFLTSLSSCGGGSGANTSQSNSVVNYVAPVTIPSGTIPRPIAGDPNFSSNCNISPGRSQIGAFKTQTGDCFVTYTVSNNDISEFKSNPQNPNIQKRLMNDVATAFNDKIDLIIVLIDGSSSEIGATTPSGINYYAQTCSIHNSSCPRFGRLGNVWLPARDFLLNGPSLHEIMHGFLRLMTTDEESGFIVPTTARAHWGFSSANGQLGGWRPDSLLKIAEGLYEAKNSMSNFDGFNTYANGANSVPYSNIELWGMGLLSNSDLQPIDVAENAAFVPNSVKRFTASKITRYTPEQILQRVKAENRPNANTPHAVRGLVVLATTQQIVDNSKILMLNAQVEEFTMLRDPKSININFNYNFWTATGQRATLQLANTSSLAR